MEKRIYINNNWQFCEGADYDDNAVQTVRLPHTVKETPFNYFDEHIYQMLSWYRRELQIPQDWKGKSVLLTFEGVAHDCEVGSHCVIVNGVSLAGEVEVGDWAIIGGHSAVQQFCRIGAHAMVGGGSLVSKDIPPYVKAAHLPVSFVGANFLGLRRRGFSSEQIEEIQNIFRVLFQSGHSYGKAVELVEEQFPQSELRDEILDFIRSSKRGILKPYNPKATSEE